MKQQTRIPNQLLLLIILFTAATLILGSWRNDNTSNDPTTLVFPPYLHTYGVRKATKYHLFLFMQNRVKFSDPQGLAVVRLDCWDDTSTQKDDDEVTVYGVNSGQNNIIYNTSMTTLGVYGLNEHDERKLNRPHGITANSRGDVYVADTGNNRIVRLFNSGRNLEFVCSIGRYGSDEGNLNQPHDVAIDVKGNIYVADTGNHCIGVFDSTNSYQYAFGIQGTEIGSLYYPTTVVVNDRSEQWSYYKDSFIIVVDLNKTRIQKFNFAGKYLTSIEAQDVGMRHTEFTYMALDYYGNVYVTDKINHCILKFDHNLNFLTSYGRKGKGDKEFIEPRGMTIYRRFGQVFIAEKEGAQYYWIGIDFDNFNIKRDPNKHNFFICQYFLTDPSFITVDVFDDHEIFVTRIWYKCFKNSGNQLDTWNGVVNQFPDSVLTKDNIQISTTYKNLMKVPKGSYKIRYKFEPTYSSYKYFSKEIAKAILID